MRMKCEIMSQIDIAVETEKLTESPAKTRGTRIIRAT